MIKPTIGRIVLFIPNAAVARGLAVPEGSELAAMVVWVHSDTMVSLTVFDPHGATHGFGGIPLEQDTKLCLSNGSFARWMPYQTGQAAKTEALQARLDSKPFGATGGTGNAPTSAKGQGWTPGGSLGQD